MTIASLAFAVCSRSQRNKLQPRARAHREWDWRQRESLASDHDILPARLGRHAQGSELAAAEDAFDDSLLRGVQFKFHVPFLRPSGQQEICRPSVCSSMA